MNTQRFPSINLALVSVMTVKMGLELLKLYSYILKYIIYIYNVVFKVSSIRSEYSWVLPKPCNSGKIIIMILTGALKLSLVFWQDVNCICRSHLELGLPLSVHEVSKITRYPSIEMLRCLEISQGHLPQIGWTWIGLR